jgi:hypothetical protein
MPTKGKYSLPLDNPEDDNAWLRKTMTPRMGKDLILRGISILSASYL